MTSSIAGFRPRQRPPGSARKLVELPAGLQARLEKAKAAVAEEFVGVTTNGEVMTGLFPIRKTGVSTEPLVRAADAFLGSLEPEQRAKALFPVDAAEWRA